MSTTHTPSELSTPSLRGDLSISSPIFSIPSIVRNIAQHVTDNIDLASLARVERYIGSIALSILWSDIEFSTLFCVFPAKVLKPSQGATKTVIRPLEGGEWNRLFTYTKKVLTLRKYKDRPTHLQNFLFGIMGHGIPSNLFPNLSEIKWRYEDPPEFPWLSLFFGENLVSLKIFPTVYHFSNDPKGQSYEQAFEAPLVVLCSLSPTSKLRQLSLPVPSGASSPVFQRDYGRRCLSVFEHHHHLESITTPVLSGVLSKLRALPKLKTLFLHFEEDIEVDQRVISSIGFPSLMELYIRGVRSLENVANHISSSGCIPSHTLEITCTTSPDMEGISSLTRKLFTEYSRARDLVSFRLSYSNTGNNKISYPFPDIPFGTTFKPLYGCHGLREFSVYMNKNYYFTEEDLKDIALSWPSIETLRFREPFQPEPTISLTGLSYLSSCERLRTLEASFKMDDSTEIPQPSIIPNCTLGYLFVRNSRHTVASSDWELACFFLKWFPHLDILVGPNPSWKDVQIKIMEVKEIIKSYQKANITV